MSIESYLQRAASVLQHTATMPSMARVDYAIATIIASIAQGKALLVCGNGGSASDAMHIAGELVGRFRHERKAIRCIALSTNAATLTSIGNDYGFEDVFARQVEAYGEAGGVLWGLSTSGNSKNVIKAFEKARAMGMTTLAFTGQGGGKMAAHADILIDVASTHTPEIQQTHLCLYHYVCERVERGIIEGG
ncbi:MAG: SIS domain-containing protein [Alphaproteobacteria bacterium]|nr:SIS domain-containing protein [Alphaproteobacteria bacterium]NDC55624.1 SIS domain-containing protein [Alphaproteobacteria bacterium]NDG04718.1 SIS domain-containing protein [Alphaproteobacteria bacterium]